MQKVFDKVTALDNKCYTQYQLNEDILMEHASSAMLNFIENKFCSKSTILVVSGANNNGADGIALARLLKGKYKVRLFLPFGVKTQMAQIQLKRASLLKVKTINKIVQSDIVVDCLFGTGLTRPLDKNSQNIIKKLNRKKSFKISCDIPSGINNLGQITTVAFKADTTIVMGALKKLLFTDVAKDYIGKLKMANLGIQRKLYEGKSNCFLLEKGDLKLPLRNTNDTNKGSFGHLAVISQEKSGAGIISAKAGFTFGSGLVTIVCPYSLNHIPHHIMSNRTLPTNATAIACGMGLGKKYDKNILQNNLPKIIDADLFYDDIILDILKQSNIVLTPHPKEFCSLLRICTIDNINVTTLQNNRFKYIKKFCQKYPQITIILKGANSLIAKNNNIYINTFGTTALSKGGSGDVLSGLIGALLAQGYNCLNAAISGSLTHTLASCKYRNNNYSLTPEKIIKKISKL